MVFNVDRRGAVRDAEVRYATHKEFADAVKLVVQKWRFAPATNKGRAVDLRVRMPVVFVIKETDPLSKWAGRNVLRRWMQRECLMPIRSGRGPNRRLGSNLIIRRNSMDRESAAK